MQRKIDRILETCLTECGGKSLETLGCYKECVGRTSTVFQDIEEYEQSELAYEIWHKCAIQCYQSASGNPATSEQEFRMGLAECDNEFAKSIVPAREKFFGKYLD